eukprot:15433662-Alexandrium_andersonii.AAC.1
MSIELEYIEACAISWPDLEGNHNADVFAGHAHSYHTDCKALFARLDSREAAYRAFAVKVTTMRT